MYKYSLVLLLSTVTLQETRGAAHSGFAGKGSTCEGNGFSDAENELCQILVDIRGLQKA